MLYNSRYRLTPEDNEIYCKRFKVSGPDVKDHHVYVYGLRTRETVGAVRVRCFPCSCFNWDMGVGM